MLSHIKFSNSKSIHTYAHLNLATKFSVVKVKCSLVKTTKFLWFGGFLSLIEV